MCLYEGPDTQLSEQESKMSGKRNRKQISNRHSQKTVKGKIF